MDRGVGIKSFTVWVYILEGNREKCNSGAQSSIGPNLLSSGLNKHRIQLGPNGGPID
jgi:hypothetical protein